ncbi:hypothetical protein CCR75_003706 [Bremia lactucae]|uniref:dCMP deaminase n=1 Tax=Bremia lactucae TaxID=4779 RepID=A0A976IJP0_BRELC|nr:hypothetical protein CCR75_003706 [Bremia lactucae]
MSEHDEPKKAKQGSGKRLNDRQRVQIIQMSENSKISKRQLADKFGVSEAAIRKLLLKRDDFLRRYYDTPEEIRDQRLRGKSTRHSIPEVEKTSSCNNCATSSPVSATTPSQISHSNTHAMNMYPSDDPWKEGLDTMLTTIMPYVCKFTQRKNPLETTVQAIESSSISATDEVVKEVKGSNEKDAENLEWMGFSRVLRDIRRGFHMYPETGYQEFRTQAFIRRFCEQALHIPSKNIREIASTGLVVDVYHDNATILMSEKRKLPIIAFRADMDALPVKELNQHLSYCSTEMGGHQRKRHKHKKRKNSCCQDQTQVERVSVSNSNGIASSGTSDVGLDVSLYTTTTNLLPIPSTITTTTIGAPTFGHDDDQDVQMSTPAAHMCGHDGHMAIILGLCVMVVRRAHLLPPNTFIRFLFQPAEEGPGGAMKLIEEGALTDVDEVYGCHNAPFSLYSIHVRPGAVMAHEVEFTIDIHGLGGHGSAPHQCIDPILAGSAVVQALQSIVSRSLAPTDTAVVSVTQFRGGDANNVIPSRVLLGGTIRDFDLEIAEKIKDHVAKLVHATCAGYGATANVHFLDGYPPVINPLVESRQVQQIAMDMGLYVSEEGLPLMAAEDFSYFLQERKGCFFFLGTKEEGDSDKLRALHSDYFDFNDKALPLGIRVFMGILQARLKCELYSMEELQAFQMAMERILVNVSVVYYSLHAPSYRCIQDVASKKEFIVAHQEQLVVAMKERKLSGRQIMELFYSEIEQPSSLIENSDAPTVFRCKCGKTRAQRLKHGYTNLVQHVLLKHMDWVAAALHDARMTPNKLKSIKHQKDGKGRDKKEQINKTAQSSIDPIPNSSVNSETLNRLTTMTPLQTFTSSSVQKRADYLSWDDYFMSVAFLSAMRSKDPSTQVDTVTDIFQLLMSVDFSIVSPERKIVGIGYNGFPNGCDDDSLPWARESATDSPLDTKYPYVCHAEMNAILNKNSTDIKGCTIYVALFPCNECAKLIIQSGISRVVYCSNKYNCDWKFVASRRLLDMAGVRYTQHMLRVSKVVIDFNSTL